MLRRLLICALAAVAALAPAPARAASGGSTSVPPADAQATPPATSGGSAYGGASAPPNPTPPAAKPKPHAAPPPPYATQFTVSPRTLSTSGPNVRFAFRIESGYATVHVRIELRRAGAPGRIRLDLGSRRTGRSLFYAWRPHVLRQGNYLVRLFAVDRRGRSLRNARAATTLSIRVRPVPVRVPPPHRTAGYAFPVAGPHNFGGPDARFGAPRAGHIHQGQDVMAAEGTPLVAPRGGTVSWTAYQPKGAGYYLVIHANDGRDYVLMHLQPGSLSVKQGEQVRTGQRVGAVGHTGDAAGPHLHFEIWVGGWQAKGGHPIDPLPDLLRWDASS